MLPWPIHRNGGAQRTQLIRQALLDSGYDVELIGILPDTADAPAGAESDPAAGISRILRYPLIAAEAPQVPRNVPQRVMDAFTSVARIKQKWRRRYSARPEVAHVVRECLASGRYSHVVVRYLHTGIVAGLSDRLVRGDVPWVADLDDVDWLTLQSRFEREPWPGMRGRLGMRGVLSIVHRRCERALAQVDACFVASEEDREVVARVGALGGRCDVLPNLPFPPDAIAPSSPNLDSLSVLFVGDLQFPPNRHGLGRFLEQAWPRVRSTQPSAVLKIVGRGLGDVDAAAWGRVPGVELIGFVDDLQEVYDEAAVVVAPIWWGGGTKIKVLEALSRGRGCVTTTQGARGYGELLKADCGLVVADPPEAMAGRLVEFLADPTLRRLAWERGPAAVREHFSMDCFRERIAATLGSIRRDEAAGQA